MRRKFFARPRTGGDGNGARVDRFAAGNIARRIADDVNLGRTEFLAVFFPGPRLRERSKLVAIVMIVGKRAELEEMPDTIMLEFQLRAPGNVAGEKSEDEVRSRLQLFQQIQNPGQEATTGSLRKFLRKMMHVTVEKSGDVFVRSRDAMLVQNVADNAGVGHTGDLDVVQIVFNPELLAQRQFERLHAGAVGMNERAIDIKKEKALLHF